MTKASEIPPFKAGQLDISERALNAMLEAGQLAERRRVIPIQPQRARQIVATTQAAIASGAFGNVKITGYDVSGSAFETYGDSFEALNLGPSEAPSGARVLLSMGESDLIYFQYTALGWGGFEYCFTASNNGSDTTVATGGNGTIIDLTKLAGIGTSAFSSNKFTVPAGKAGYYELAGATEVQSWTNTAFDDWMRLSIVTGAGFTVVSRSTIPVNDAHGFEGDFGISIPLRIVYLAAGWIVQLRGQVISAGTAEFGGTDNETWLSIKGPMPDGS